MKDKDYPAALRLKDDKFITCIGNIRLKAEKIFADSLLPHYTRHDVKHSETIIKRIGELLEEHPEKLNEQERFILIAAAYLHDIGMQYPTYSGLPLKVNYTIEELEEVRKNHHEASYTIIRESVKNDAKIKLGLYNCEYYADSIANVARYHRKLDINKLENTSLSGKNVRLKLLAALLRLSDALDLGWDRVITDTLNQRMVPVESKFHWWCHLFFKSVLIESGKIQIYLFFPNCDKEIIDVIYGKLKEFVITPFLETYDILHESGVRLYKEPVFKPDKEKTATAIDVPEDLLNYIKDSILGIRQNNVKIRDKNSYSQNEVYKSKNKILKITFYYHRSNKVFCTDIAEKQNFTGFKISLSEDIVDQDSDLLVIFCSDNISLSNSALSFIDSINKGESNCIIPVIFKGTNCPAILNDYNKIIIEPGANIQAARKIINYIVYRILNKRSPDLQSITIKIHDLRNDNFLGNGTIISPYGDIVTSGEVLRKTQKPLSSLEQTKFEIKFPSFNAVLEARITNVYEGKAPFDVVFLKLDDNNRFSKGDCPYASLLPYSSNINTKISSYAWNPTSYSEIDGEIIDVENNENNNYIKKFITRRSVGGISGYYCGSPILSNDNYCIIGVIILVQPVFNSDINQAICCTSDLLKKEFGINNIFDNSSFRTSKTIVESKMIKSKIPESNILKNEDKNLLKGSAKIEPKLDAKENLTNVDSTSNPLKVFLCYAKEDIKKVRNLYRKLSKDNIELWLDENELEPGDEWQLSIEKAIEESSIVIVCLSNKSINKTGYVNKEIKICLDKADKMPEGKIFIIPVRFEDCKVPERLIKWQYADYPLQYEKLIKTLRKRLKTNF